MGDKKGRYCNWAFLVDHKLWRPALTGKSLHVEIYSYHVLLYLINLVLICVTMRFRFYIKIFTPGRSFVLLSLTCSALNFQNAFGAWRVTGLVGVSTLLIFFKSIFSRFWNMHMVLQHSRKIYLDTNVLIFLILQLFWQNMW